MDGASAASSGQFLAFVWKESEEMRVVLFSLFFLFVEGLRHHQRLKSTRRVLGGDTIVSDMKMES